MNMLSDKVANRNTQPNATPYKVGTDNPLATQGSMTPENGGNMTDIRRRLLGLGNTTPGTTPDKNINNGTAGSQTTIGNGAASNLNGVVGTGQ